MSARTQKVSVILIDDDFKVIETLKGMLVTDERISVSGTFTDPEVALMRIIEKKPDLLILDIQMPGMSGFELVKELNECNIRPFVIFITAFDQYAIEAIRVSAFDYLLKPVDPAHLSKTMERFLSSFQQKTFENNYKNLINQLNIRKIRFNTAGGFILVDPGDIAFIKADWNYSEIFFGMDKKEMIVMNLGFVEKLLPSDDFARINRSVIINLKYLERVNRGKKICTLKKGDETFTFNIPLRRIRELEEML